MNTGIYQIRNTITNKIYIGSTGLSFKTRKKQHFSQLEYQRHHNPHLQNSYNKYGKDVFVFEILEYCEKKDLDIREQYFITLLNPKFNIRKDVRSNRGTTWTKEQKKRFSESVKEKIKNGDIVIKTKAVLVYTFEGIFIKEFSSINEAADFAKCAKSNVSSVLTNRWALAKGYHFRYKVGEIEQKIEIVIKTNSKYARLIPKEKLTQHKKRNGKSTKRTIT